MTADVGSKSTAGDTPQGLADMSGNVWACFSGASSACCIRVIVPDGRQKNDVLIVQVDSGIDGSINDALLLK